MTARGAAADQDYDFGTGGSGRFGGGPGQGGRLIMTGIIVMDALPALTCTGAVAILADFGQALLDSGVVVG
jgi:hypothetical protein